MPCVAVESRLLERLNYVSEDKKTVQAFSACIRKYRVCLLGEDGGIVKAQIIRDLPRRADSMPPFFDNVVFGIIQTPSTEDVKLCLSAVFSGGSAAAWSFYGWRLGTDRVIELPGMGKGDLNSDAVPARTLANIIYDTYEKYGKP